MSKVYTLIISQNWTGMVPENGYKWIYDEKNQRYKLNNESDKLSIKFENTGKIEKYLLIIDGDILYLYSFEGELIDQAKFYNINNDMKIYNSINGEKIYMLKNNILQIMKKKWNGVNVYGERGILRSPKEYEINSFEYNKLIVDDIIDKLIN